MKERLALYMLATVAIPYWMLSEVLAGRWSPLRIRPATFFRALFRPRETP